MYVFVVFLVRIFLHFVLKISVFSLNAGKYGPEKLRTRTLFTQCIPGTYTEVSSTQTFFSNSLKLQN